MTEYICPYCDKILHSKTGLSNHVKYCTMNPNRIDPPTKGRKCSEEHKQKVSESLKGKTFSDEHKKKLSDKAKGRQHTEEWKKSHSGKMTGENNPFFGKHHTNETKQRISDKKINTHITEEHKQKISEWNNTRWANISEEEKTRFIEKCSNSAQLYWDNMSEEDRIIFANKISASYKLKTDDEKNIIYYKGIETKRKNNTFNTSKIETELKNYFDSNNIEYITQYKSDLYPFWCDFYFPDKDLYVEIQGCWTHGGKPYIETDQDCIKQLEIWKSKNTKFYDNAIDTWTIRDVKKRETAKINNLNWIEIFSNDLETCINIIKNYGSII